MAKSMPCMAANPAGSERRKASSNERNISRHSMNDIRHSSFIPDVIVSCCAVAPPSSSFKQASKQECCNRTFAAFRRPSSVVRRCFAAFCFSAFCFLLFAFCALCVLLFAFCFSAFLLFAFLLFCFSAFLPFFAFLLFAFLPFCFLLFAFCILLFPQLSAFCVPLSSSSFLSFLPFLLRSFFIISSFHFNVFDGLCNSRSAATVPQCQQSVVVGRHLWFII